MLLAQSIFIFLHILAAAAVFGLGLPLARQARVVAETGSAELARQGTRSAMLMTIFGGLTLVFAVTAFVLGGVIAYQAGIIQAPVPFAYYGPEFHTSLLLILLLIGAHVGLVHAGWVKLNAALAQGGDVQGPRKRIAAGIGVVHLLWVVILVLMLWGDISAGLANL